MSLALALTASLHPWTALPNNNDEIRLIVQNAPLAGSQYHALPLVWRSLRVGDPLRLIREPDNPHDPRAVRIDWNDHPLGYLPRRQNHMVSEALDRGEELGAKIQTLRPDPNPWKWVEIEIFFSSSPVIPAGPTPREKQ